MKIIITSGSCCIAYAELLKLQGVDALPVSTAAWFLNLVSISEGKSYFITSNRSVQKWLTRLLGLHFTDSTAQAERLWLRKEIIKQSLMEV